MLTIHQKHQILASIDSMDQTQTEKVLGFIRGVLNNPVRRNQQLKSEALRQIRQALAENVKQ